MTGCVICGEPLRYDETSRQQQCSECGEVFSANVSCEHGHYVCDACHAMSATDVIEKECLKSSEKDPIRLALELMRHYSVKMHGPEHHFLVPAVLLTAKANIEANRESLAQELSEARLRAEKVLGGFCGTHGVCGAAVGTGLFMSVATGSTPLAKKQWRLSNLMTSQALRKIALRGGPRCCKRDTFVALEEAIGFCRDKLDLVFPTSTQIVCEWADKNNECLKKGCRYYEAE